MDDRMSSGMKITEAVASAERWWDTVGRGLVPRQLNRIDKGRTTFGKAGPMIKIVDIVHDLPTGILQALPWAELTRGEQLREELATLVKEDETPEQRKHREATEARWA